MTKSKKSNSNRPDYFTHIDDATPIPDTCGQIRELHSSENLSLAHVILNGKAEKHRHSIMEEVYFILNGQGYLTIDKEKYAIRKGDTINIPKETWHYLETDGKSELEVLVITYPKFTLDDVILE